MARKGKVRDWRAAVAEQGVIAVLRADGEQKALRAARAALAGGIKVMEITLNTPGALRVIKELRGEKELFLGAGTVRSVKAAKAALKAGASFIVCPHFDRRIVSMVTRRGLLVIPGCTTPSEIMAARERGAGMIKIFPAHLLGGPEYIRALLAPLPDLQLVPSGGVGLKNINDYFTAGAAAVFVGEAVFKKELLISKNYEGIAAAAKRLIEIVGRRGPAQRT